MKKALAILPICAAMLLAAIPVSANYSVGCLYGSENVGFHNVYNWDIGIFSFSAYASGNYGGGNGTVHCYLNTDQGLVSASETNSCSVSEIQFWTYSGGVDFYDM